MLDVLQINPADNVCVANRPLPAGTRVTCGETSFVLEQAVPLGAKLALTNLKSGDQVIKFGVPIGTLTSDAPPGSYIHTHNLRSDYLKTYARGDLI